MRPPAGLCDSCRHQRLVGTTRGSEFSLCLRSRVDPEEYPRYPRVPVHDCRGFERVGGRAAEGQPAGNPPGLGAEPAFRIGGAGPA